MDEEDAQISKIAACILVGIIVILATILLGCSEQTRTSSMDSDAHVFWCIGACATARTEIARDNKHATKENEE